MVAVAPALREKAAKAPASAADTPSQAGRGAFDRVLMEALEGATSGDRAPLPPQFPRRVAC